MVDREYLLERLPGKYGWTYTVIPEIRPDPDTPFSWVKVRGSIDGHEIRNYRLMPSGDVMPCGKGVLFLAVKAELRKKIGKGAGDHVRIILYPDSEPAEVPGELLLCLREDPEALQFFNSLKEGEQQNYVRWIYSAGTEQARVNRIAKALDMLSNRQKFTGRL